MTLAAIGPFVWPDPNGMPSANITHAMSAAAHKVAFRVQAPKTGSLGKVKFRLGTVTTGDTLKVSFQNEDPATGDPDGVVDQYRTIVVANTDDDRWVLTGLLTSDGTDTGTKRSVTKGDHFFVVIEFSSWVAGNLQIVSSTPSGYAPLNNAYVDVYTASWAKGTAIFNGIVLYDDDSFAATPTALPAMNSNNAGAFNTGTTPDEVAAEFVMPIEMVASGALVFADLDGDVDIVLYDSGGTALASASFDKDVRSGTAIALMAFQFSVEVTLSAGATYYLAIKPTTTTTANYRYSDVPSAAEMAALPDGAVATFAQRTDGGAWTPNTARRLRAHLLISQIHDGSGSGASVPMSRVALGM